MHRPCFPVSYLDWQKALLALDMSSIVVEMLNQRPFHAVKNILTTVASYR